LKETPSVASLSDHMKKHPISPNPISERDAAPISRRELYELKRKEMEDVENLTERK